MIVWWSCAPKNVENYASESRGKMVEQIKKTVEDADLVLVGIGEDFGISEKQIMNERPEVFADETLGEQALGYLVCQCRLQEAGDAARYSAYKNLWNLMQWKPAQKNVWHIIRQNSMKKHGRQKRTVSLSVGQLL